MCYSSYFK